MNLNKAWVVALVAVFLFAAPGLAYAKRQAGSDQIGAEDHPAILAQFGGEIDDPKLSEYVSRIGNSLARATDEAQEQWVFTVLDSPVVNAFALPGGYVYVTRGLMAIANNEAELAGVLGHEIGHIISGHGEKRIKRQNRAGIGVLLGTILGGVIGGQDGAADAIELGSRILGGYLSSHSKSEELAADRIGVRLLVKAGYSPYAQAEFLDQLTAKEALERKVAGQQYNPNRVDFFASHPATGKRVRKAVEAARKSGLAVGEGALKETSYLARIDGIIYGDTAKEGFIRGRNFSHPEMRITFTAPEGFILSNSSQQVDAQNNTGARMIFDGDAKWTHSMEAYITQRWVPAIGREVTTSDLRSVHSVQINGHDAAMAMVNVTTADGPMIAQLTAIRQSNITYRIVGLTKKADGASRNALNTAAQSFRALTSREAAGLRPYHLRVVSVKRADTVASLAKSMPNSGFQEAQFRAMNGYDKNSDMQAGDLVKIIE